jgi:hypothetical protein
MTLLNKKIKAAKKFSPTVEVQELDLSKNGNLQLVKNSKSELVDILTSTLYGKDSFYESTSDSVIRMKEAIKKLLAEFGADGAEFAAKAAIFAKNQMYIRTMPVVMVVELFAAMRAVGIKLPNAKHYVAATISRADQLTDLYAYSLTVFGTKNKVPIAIKEGVALAFNKFDTYQFGKYNPSSGLTLSKLLRIVHPTPASVEQGLIFDKIIKNTLEAPNTWEVLLSTNGQKPVGERLSDKDLWTSMIKTEGSGSLGYMALLRNLRNICKADVDADVLTAVCKRISDPIEVKKSKQLPWAFINAYDVAESEGLPVKVLSAISTATDISVANIPSIGDKPWVILDCSGSMSTIGISKNPPIKIGAIFAAALCKASKDSTNFALTLFSDRAENLNLNPTDSIMTLYKNIMKKVYGGGTNLQAALDLKKSLKFLPDACVILSDMEVNPIVSSNSRYGYYGLGVVDLPEIETKIAVNIASGSTTPLDVRAGWQQLSGFSENMFKYLSTKKQGTASLIQAIEKADYINKTTNKGKK